MPFTEAVTVNPVVSMTKGETYPFVEMAAVNSGARSVHESEHRKFKSGGARFTAGDTLMARITPCLENGKIARFQPHDGLSTGFGSTEFIVIRGKPNITTDDFAYYLTKWQEFRQFAIGQMTGSSGRQRVPADSLTGFEAAIPPLATQRRIANILGTLDDKIELNQRMNRTLEKMAAALFKSWFIDFLPVRAKMAAKQQDAIARTQTGDPVHAKADRLLPLPLGEGRGEGSSGLPAAIADLFPDTFQPSALGPIPTGWIVGKLADIASNPRRTVKPSEIAPDTPYIGLQDMPRRSIALDTWGRAAEVSSGKSRFNEAEILFGKLRPYFHKVGMAPVNGVCSTDILVIVPKSAAWRGYVLSLVSSKPFIDYTTACSAGTKMPRTNWKDMARYALALPPASLPAEFENRIQSLHKRMSAAIHESIRLTKLRDTLLPKLISGELSTSYLHL